LRTDDSTGLDRCVVVAEAARGEVPAAMNTALREKLKNALLVTPEVEILSPGSFERTTFKAKRFVDKREVRT
ncbi:MAG: phenylacetate--CoA ligase family protein, partial [bacterium]